VTGERQPSDEEIRAQIEEELRKIRVEDVLVQTAVTLVNLAGRKLTAEGERDLGQAKLAIDGARALQPLLPPDPGGAVRDALSQLQVMFAREAQGGPGPAGKGERTAAEAAAQPSGPETEEAERAKARAKIWTPPGT
jgi:hypothetical protein